MKHLTAILAVLLVIVTVAFGFSYNYRKQRESYNNNISAVSTEKRKDNKKTERRIILEDKKNNYRLSADDTSVYLYYDGYEKEFEQWLDLVNEETPQIYCKDYDKDGKKELLIKLFSDRGNEYNVNIYSLIMIKSVEKENSKKEFLVVSNSDNTWRVPFTNAINCEMTQLYKCKKIIQFVMDDAAESIAYDSKTGITTNKHVGFAKALSSNSGKYYTLDHWNKGYAVYDIDEDGNPTVDIQLLAYYKEFEEPQMVGYIHSDIAYMDKELSIVPGTIVFRPQSGFEVSDPRDTAKSKWTVEINNSGNSGSNDNNIDWIDSEFAISKMNSNQSLNLSSMTSKIKLVDKIKITQSSVTLTAQDGCAFSPNIVSAGEFSVVINDGKKENANIAYECKIKTVKGRSTLVITFDKTYDKEDLEKLIIKFGA